MQSQILSKVGFEQAFNKMLDREIERSEGASGTLKVKRIVTVPGRPSKAALQEVVRKIAHFKKDGEHGEELDNDSLVDQMTDLIDECRTLLGIANPYPSFGYYINLNERGYFEADVRDQSGKSIFEVKSGLSLAAGESDLIEDGFMKHANDLKGLETYLKSLRLLPDQGRLMSAKKFDEIF